MARHRLERAQDNCCSYEYVSTANEHMSNVFTLCYRMFYVFALSETHARTNARLNLTQMNNACDANYF
jgi:hypothetical protein